METGTEKVARATITGFNAKLDRVLESKRAGFVGPAGPDLPVLNALSGTYVRRSGGLLPVLDHAARLVREKDAPSGTRQTLVPPPESVNVVAVGRRSPKESAQAAGRMRRAS